MFIRGVFQKFHFCAARRFQTWNFSGAFTPAHRSRRYLDSAIFHFWNRKKMFRALEKRERVPESPWNPHKSTDHKNLHRNYTRFFSNSENIFFVGVRKQIHENYFRAKNRHDNFENPKSRFLKILMFGEKFFKFSKFCRKIFFVIFKLL